MHSKLNSLSLTAVACKAVCSLSEKSFGVNILCKVESGGIYICTKKKEVPPRLELGSLDSKSRVLTITPWDLD